MNRLKLNRETPNDIAEYVADVGRIALGRLARGLEKLAQEPRLVEIPLDTADWPTGELDGDTTHVFAEAIRNNANKRIPS